MALIAKAQSTDIGKLAFVFGAAASVVFVAAGADAITAAVPVIVGAVMLTVLMPRQHVLGTASALAICLALITTGSKAPELTNEAGTVGAFAFFTIGLVRSSGKTGILRRSPLVATLAFGYSAVLTFASLTGPSTASPARSIAIIALGLFAFYAGRRFTALDFRSFGTWFLVFALAQVVYSIPDVMGSPLPNFSYATFTGGTRHTNLLVPGAPRIQGMLEHPIVCAAILAVAVVIVVTSARHMKAVTRLGSVAVLVAGIVYTGSRSALVALAFALLVGMIIYAASRKSRVFWTLILGAAAVIALQLQDTRAYLSAAVDELFGSASYTHRSGSWSVADQLLGNRPEGQILFGSGLGSIDTLYDQNVIAKWDILRTFDNQYMTSLATAGLVGVLIVCLLMIVGTLRGSRVVKTFTVFAAAMFLSFDWLDWVAPMMVFFLMFGLLEARKNRTKTRPQAIQLAAQTPALR